MIPLRDENPTRITPYVTYALIAVNALLFLYNGPVTQHGNRLDAFMLIPRYVTMGARSGIESPIPAWVTLLTHAYLHASWLHLAGNMLFLWIFGNNIEDVLGHLKYVAFYTLCGLGAAFAQILVAPDSQYPMLGASGAIAGILGAYLLLFPRARIVTLVFLFIFIQVTVLPAYVFLGIWFALQVVYSLVSMASGTSGGGVAFAAHIGGFISGLALILLFGGRRLLQGRRPVEYIPVDRW